MTGWIISFVLILIYVASVIWCRHETIVFHSRLKYVKPSFGDLILTFIPVVNLIGACVTATENHPKKNTGLTVRLTKRFFSVK